VAIYDLKETDMAVLARQKALRADLTEGPLLGKIWKFTLPIIATGLLQTLYNASDMIVVGRFAPNGAFAMGAVGACGSLINLIVNLFMGLSTGAGVCVARAVGAGRSKDVKDLVHTSSAAGLICGIFVGILGFLLAEPLLLLMGTPSDILIEAVPYMRAYFVGIPAMMIYNFLAACLRATGDTKRPLIFLACAGLLNVGLNLVMVLAFGMGAVGVGISTTAAQYASAAMIIVYMRKTSGDCRLSLREMKIHKRCFIGIVENGLPAGIQSLVFGISNVLIQSSVNAFGPETIAGSAAAANIENFIYIAMNSFFQTAITFTGQHVGAGKIERIKKIALYAVASVAVTGIVLGSLCFIFREPLLSIYIDEADKAVEARIMEAGALRMSIIGALYFLCGIMETLGGMVRGMGRSIQPTVVAIFGSCLMRIVWIFTVCPFFPGNLAVLLLAYPVTWILTITGHATCAVWSYKQLKGKKEEAHIA